MPEFHDERFGESRLLAGRRLETARREISMRGRILEALGDGPRAIETARTARDTYPKGGYLGVFLGDTAYAVHDAELALSAYREALALLARSKAPEKVRARVYAKIGRAEEQRGHPDRAYEDYRRALKLDPEEPWAKRRVKEIEGAAGL